MKSQKQSHEYISALMDGELNDEKHQQDALNELLADPEARQKWHEYHLIRDCLQNPSYTRPQLSEALKAETILQPYRKKIWAANLPFNKGIAAAVCLAIVSLVAWNIQTNEQTTVSPNKIIDARLKMLDDDIKIGLNQPQSTATAEQQKEALIKVGYKYLNAHQQAIGQKAMQQTAVY